MAFLALVFLAVGPEAALAAAGAAAGLAIGAEAQYSFIRKPDWRLYSLLGMGFYTSTSSDSAKPGNRIANPFRLGLGLGYEWFASDQFVVSLAGALTYFPNTSEFLPTPEVGLFWYFR